MPRRKSKSKRNSQRHSQCILESTEPGPLRETDDEPETPAECCSTAGSNPDITDEPEVEILELCDEECPGATVSFQYEPEKKFEIARRPGYGKAGYPIHLLANYFLLNFKDTSIYHYDVDFVFKGGKKKKYSDDDAGGGSTAGKPRKTKKDALDAGESSIEHQMKRVPGKERCRKIFAKLIQIKGLKRYCPVFDSQKNVYTTSPFPMTGQVIFPIEIDETDGTLKFDVIVKPVMKETGGNVISLEPLFQLYTRGQKVEVPQEILMAFDTVMCHRDPPPTQIQVGRSFFSLEQRYLDLKSSLELRRGYNQSIHLTERGLAVVVDTVGKAFHKSGDLIDYVCEFLGYDITKEPRIRGEDLKRLRDRLKNVAIEVTHLPYRKKMTIDGVTDTAANSTRLTDSQKTVATYFSGKYGPLKYPHLPCLIMQTKQNKNRKKKEDLAPKKITYEPMEVCRIRPDQPALQELSRELRTTIIQKTAVRPKKRIDDILEKLNEIQNVSGEVMHEFGLSMDLRLMQVQGRVLPAPAIAYRDSTEPVLPNSGKWSMDGKQLLRSTENCPWIVINFSKLCGRDILQNCVNILRETACAAGMMLSEPLGIHDIDSRTSVRSALALAKDREVGFALVVVNAKDEYHNYEEVKFVSDVQLHLITQCVNDDTLIPKKNPRTGRVKRFDTQVARNIVLKINAKIGGVNHSIQQKHSIFKEPVIIMGADAAHSPRGSHRPSVAAVVGSLDPHSSQYSVACRTQSNPDSKKMSQEIIIQLREMVRHILNEFVQRTRGRSPERIIFFRDGVSDGQFTTVLDHEVQAVKMACEDELGGTMPKLTYVIVQKRHHTRLFPDPQSQETAPNSRGRYQRRDDEMRNVTPGTTVDTGITHPVHFDFFLCSHEGIQGTSRPAHYTVIYDENDFSADDMQKICYHLCHTYARCNRSVSVPPPVLYADLACSRALKYMNVFSDCRSTSSSGSSDEDRLPPEVEEAIKNMSNFTPGLFYI